jgi:hypothetical protein
LLNCTLEDVVEMAVGPADMQCVPYPTGSLFLDRRPSQRFTQNRFQTLSGRVTSYRDFLSMEGWG